jgi:hypothetical protein
LWGTNLADADLRGVDWREACREEEPGDVPAVPRETLERVAKDLLDVDLTAFPRPEDAVRFLRFLAGTRGQGDQLEAALP